MITKDFLLKIEQIPEYLLTEILDFVQFVKAKHLQEKIEITVLSQSSLEKDWLKPGRIKHGRIYKR